MASERVSFAETCRRMALLAARQSAQGRMDAAALRQLTQIVERAERWEPTGGICDDLRAGFQQEARDE